MTGWTRPFHGGMDALLETLAKALIHELGATVRIMDGGVDAIIGGTTYRIKPERVA